MARNTRNSAGNHTTDPADRRVARASGTERAARVAALRDALIAGEQSGPPRPFDNDAFLARKRAKLDARR